MRRTSIGSEAQVAVALLETDDANAIFVASLRSELLPLKKSELRRKAAALRGVTSYDLEQGDDAPDSRDVFVNLIIEHTPKPHSKDVDKFEVAKIAGTLLFCVELNEQMLGSFFVSWCVDRGLTMSQIGRMMFVLSISLLGMGPWSATLIKKVGCNRLQYVASWGFIICRLCYVLMQFVPVSELEMLGSAIFFCIGLFGVLSETSASAWVLTSVEPDERNAAMGVLVATRCAAGFFSPALGGVLYDLGGFSTPIVFGCAVFALVLIVKKNTILSKVPPEETRAATQSGSILWCLPVSICMAMNFAIGIVFNSCIVWFQPFLFQQYHMSSTAYGIMMSLLSCIFILATKAVAPVSKALGEYLTMAIAITFVAIGFLCLGPSPYLTFLPPPSSSTLWVPIAGIGIFLFGWAFPAIMLGAMSTNFASRAGWSEIDAATQMGMLGTLMAGATIGTGPLIGGYSVQNLGIPVTSTCDALTVLMGILPLLAWLASLDRPITKDTDSKKEALLSKEPPTVQAIPEETNEKGIFDGLVCCFYAKCVTDYEDYHE